MTSWSKYLAFAHLGARQALSERAELYGRVAFFAVILGVFSSLWNAVGRLPVAGSAEDLVWYLAATEWILLSAPQLHSEVQEELRRGDLVLRWVRPVSYTGSVLAQGLGALCVRAPILGLTAFCCAYAFTGSVPAGAALGATFALGLLASALLMSFYLTLGICAFWLTDVSPLYWLWQKALFVLGGLMLPLGFYPQWLARLAGLTPFPSVLCFPASFLLGVPLGEAGLVLTQLLGWVTVSLLFLCWLFRRALRSLAING
jgi:ABC-2 type transport system permease protein